MAAKRKNEAITANGSPYNKRQRPDSFAHGPPPVRYPTHDAEARNANDRDSERSWTRNTKKRSSWYSSNRQKGNDPASPPFEQRSTICLPLTTAVQGFDDIPDNGVLEYLRSVRDEAARLPFVYRGPILGVIRTESSENADAEADSASEPNSEDLPQRIEDDFGDEVGYNEEDYNGGDNDYYEEDGEYYEEQDGEYYERQDVKYYDGQDGETYDDDEEESTPDVDFEPAAQDIHPQAAYTSRVSQMLLARRAVLQAPPQTALATLTPEHKTFCGKDEPTTGNYIVTSRDPIPAQLASMKTSTIGTLLISCRRLLKTNSNISPRLSVWFWALFARLPDVGQMDSDSIFDLRVLAKRAISLRCAFDRRGAMTAARMGLGPLVHTVSNTHSGDQSKVTVKEAHNLRALDDGPTSEAAFIRGISNSGTSEKKPAEAVNSENARTGPPPHDIDTGDPNGEEAMELETDDEATVVEHTDTDVVAPEAAKQQLANQLNTLESAGSEDGEVDEATEAPLKVIGEQPQEEIRSTYPDLNTRVTLDFIITVVGDLYGQRDLLACREQWDAEEGS